jgi:hypothetical protein
VLLAVAAVACACLSGLVLGLGGRRAPGAGVGLAALAALVIAPTGSGESQAAPRTLELRAPAPTAPATATPPPAVRNPTAGRRPGRVARDPAALVRAFYADLDARRYREAWERLGPAVRRSFGGFAVWRDGYATTAAHAVADLEADAGEVTHTLVASCGATSGRYAVRWRFDGAKAVGLTAAALSGRAC